MQKFMTFLTPLRRTAYILGTALTFHPRRPPRNLGQSAQTTAEYALVLLGAATIAMLLTAWAGQTNRLGSLFDAVLRSVTNLVT